MIKLSITQATCRVSKTADEHITAGMIGKVVHVDLADDWSDLVKVAVCSGSGATKDVVGWTDRFVIPSEVCKNAGSVLKIGIYGYRTLDEEVIFATPTVVANLGAIEPSLSPSGDTTTEASAEVWQQILSVAESKLADAPQDGKQYLRKDGSWEELGPDEETASRIEAIEAKEAIWDSKAAGDHNHAGVYQPAGSYASASHNHAGVYQPVGDYANSNHTHSYNTLTDKPTIPEAYNDTALKNRVAAIEIKESTWDGKQDAISDLATIRAGAAAGATALQELPEHGHADSDITMTDYQGTLQEAFAYAGGALTGLQSGLTELGDGLTNLGNYVEGLSIFMNEKVPEAPRDNKVYGRKNGEWEEVPGGGSTGFTKIYDETLSEDVSAFTIPNVSDYTEIDFVILNVLGSAIISQPSMLNVSVGNAVMSTAQLGNTAFTPTGSRFFGMIGVLSLKDTYCCLDTVANNLGSGYTSAVARSGCYNQGSVASLLFSVRNSGITLSAGTRVIAYAR